MFLRALVAAMALVCATSGFAQEFDEPDLHEGDPPAAVQATPGSFVVRISTDSIPILCTGFFVKAKYVVMEGHCAQEVVIKDVFTVEQAVRTIRTDYTVTTDTGQKLKAILSAFADPFAGGQDWAILVLTDPAPPGWIEASLDCSSAPIALGTQVITDGFPFFYAVDAGVTRMAGFVSGSARMVPGSPWQFPLIPLSMPLAKGVSGAPVQLQDGGKVIGIASGFPDIQPSWSYAQPIAPVCAALHIK